MGVPVNCRRGDGGYNQKGHLLRRSSRKDILWAVEPWCKHAQGGPPMDRSRGRLGDGDNAQGGVARQ